MTQDETMTSTRILGCASEGSGGNDEDRLRVLLTHFSADFVVFIRSAKKQSFMECMRRMRGGGFDLFVLEGTGIAAGSAAILGQLLYKRRFVLSSGDAVGPFLSAILPLGQPLFSLYERMLYRYCSGFIGWTPYLVGRALTMGAKRGVTIPGWAPYDASGSDLAAEGRRVREDLGIPASALVFGIVGALVWSDRFGYCYGSELIRAANKAQPRPYVLVVGDGTGAPHLKQLAGDALGKTVLLPGRISRDQVPAYLAAMDVASLPQSVDGVGSFRYSTKIAEYRQAGVPFVINEIPMSYDLDEGDLWRLPGDSPWSTPFIDALAKLMSGLTREEAATRKSLKAGEGVFNRETQILRVTAFLNDILVSTS